MRRVARGEYCSLHSPKPDDQSIERLKASLVELQVDRSVIDSLVRLVFELVPVYRKPSSAEVRKAVEFFSKNVWSNNFKDEVPALKETTVLNKLREDAEKIAVSVTSSGFWELICFACAQIGHSFGLFATGPEIVEEEDKLKRELPLIYLSEESKVFLLKNRKLVSEVTAKLLNRIDTQISETPEMGLVNEGLKLHAKLDSKSSETVRPATNLSRSLASYVVDGDFSDERRRLALENVSRRLRVVIDTRPLLGESGEAKLLMVPARETAFGFLNNIYFTINARVQPFTFGTVWGLQDEEKGWVYDGGNPEEILSYMNDDVESIGLHDNMRLSVVWLSSVDPARLRPFPHANN
jgi:hypothetical protein